MLETEEIKLHSGGEMSPRGSRQRSSRGVWVAIIVLLIVAGVVIAGVVPREKAKAALKTETYDLAVPTVVAIHPKLGAPQTEIVLPGNIQAFIDSPIYARTNGYLKKWYADIGTHVKQGQLLADIETPEVDQQLDQARADLNTAQANARLSEITATRYQDLAKTEAVSKQDVDNAVGDYAAKKAMVASAQSNVKRLEELQSFERIYAPFDGVITARGTGYRTPDKLRRGCASHGVVSHRGNSLVASIHQCPARVLTVRSSRVDRRFNPAGVPRAEIQGKTGAHGELH